MPKSSQISPATGLLFGTYTILIFLAFIASTYAPDAAPQPRLEGGRDLAGFEKICFILIPCWMAGSLIFLGVLFYEKMWQKRRLLSKRNLDQSLIHLGFLIISLIAFSIGT